MNKKLFNIAGVNTVSLRLFILLIILTPSLRAQTISNLEIFYQLVDSASSQASQNIIKISNEVAVTFDLGLYYTIFENRIISQLGVNGLKVNRGTDSNVNKHNLNFIIDKAEVIYGEQKRDGFLGDFFVSREVILSGNYLVSSPSASLQNGYREFHFKYSDRIKVEDIEKVENRSFPFTQGRIPSVPFFSSLLEPVIAVGAAAAAVILFFSIRSK